MSPEPAVSAITARAIVLEARPLGDRDRLGHLLFALDVTVVAADRSPIRTRLSVGVPEARLSLVYPGAELDALVSGPDEAPTVTLDLR